jgi:hypothetical protein
VTVACAEVGTVAASDATAPCASAVSFGSISTSDRAIDHRDHGKE